MLKQEKWAVLFCIQVNNACINQLRNPFSDSLEKR